MMPDWEQGVIARSLNAIAGWTSPHGFGPAYRAGKAETSPRISSRSEAVMVAVDFSPRMGAL